MDGATLNVRVLLSGQTVYISGPMTGIVDLNRAEFFRAEQFLIESGAKQVINPQYTRLLLGDDADRELYLEVARLLLTRVVSLIVVLPGYEQSAGCAFELDVAGKLKIPTVKITNLKLDF